MELISPSIQGWWHKNVTYICIYIYIRKDEQLVQLYDIFNFDKISDKMDGDKQIINIVLDKNKVTEF